MFTAGGAIAAKSLSITHVASRNVYVLVLGFAELQAGYPVKLTEVEIGPMPTDGEMDAISQAMDAKAHELGEVISQSTTIGPDGIIRTVFMQVVYIG